MKVPFLDLKTQYKGIKGEIMKAIVSVCNEQSFILGPQVKQFEKDIEKYYGIAHAIGVASGSDALLLSLMAFGIGQGDEVLTSPYTFFATAGSIWRLGARPVFVDIDPVLFNISPEKLKRKITRRTKGIMPVHLFGQVADMDPIMEIAKARGIPVIEDAAQSIGAEYKGKKAGTIGDMGCFSFYPSKNLGGFGDGGMIITDNDELDSKLRMLRVHGSSSKYRHEMTGCNSRLDSVQAAVLSVKLRYLEGWTKARIRNAERYKKLFQKKGLLKKIKIPSTLNGSRHVFNQFVIRVPRRDDLRGALINEGIGTEIYYPLPLHLQPCFSELGYKEGDLKESEQAAKECLALPIYPELTEEMQRTVVESIARFYRIKRR